MKSIVIGAGPTGLGAAYRLHELGQSDWQVFERSPYVGGLSASFVDDAGFTWDVGGHVLFSHYDYFDRVVEEALRGAYLQHMRESWVRILDTWVPYPFQNNIRHLPSTARDECVDGLRSLPGQADMASNFKQWMDEVFGAGIVKYFMAPYNFKVWATPAELMSKDWIAERVSVVDLDRIEQNIAKGRDDLSWGPNNTFKFPRQGGTRAIFDGVADGLQGKVKNGHELVSLDVERKLLTFANGVTQEYDTLVSTMPVDQLVACCGNGAPQHVREAATQLVHNSVYVVGLGFSGRRVDSKCWMYFPEDNCPFYRVTNFHNYSPFNVPNGEVDKYFSLMCEVSYSSYKPVQKETVVESTIQGLLNSGVIDQKDRESIVSRYLLDVPYAYPVPTMGRDQALNEINTWLESHSIFSRGRFGAWRYEVGNMDHSFMQGVEVVDRILRDQSETTLRGCC
mgnify:CR=1 FL=1